jgi:hypothetical protein
MAMKDKKFVILYDDGTKGREFYSKEDCMSYIIKQEENAIKRLEEVKQVCLAHDLEILSPRENSYEFLGSWQLYILYHRDSNAWQKYKNTIRRMTQLSNAVMKEYELKEVNEYNVLDFAKVMKELN